MEEQCLSLILSANVREQNMDNNSGFFDTVATIIEQARRFVGRTADLTMSILFFTMIC